ncbi:transcriptional activator leucine zipper [Scheffersomyces xylosifermentans]|uniref:transcriptional activator leucine zipper n=1 Tax=Scheffersomyces xylosifermentans TaxID=1304137 RepID=UPI00315DDC30
MQRLTLSNGEEFSSIRRGLATDSKTPAEYTLHIIFTQFVRHAERKLNLCLDYPLDEEPPIIDLLAEGVDTQFDKIVASLGYIARRKPKPVIDSVMFWRKSKSEVASMAASEVERTLVTAKVNLMKANNTLNGSGNAPISPTNPGIAKNSNSASRSKRSLSLIRTKSFSKVSHRRNQSTSAAVPTYSNGSGSVSATSSRSSSFENEFIRQKNYYDEQIASARETAIHADRKSLASIYILCRVLIEVVKQTSYEVMGEDLEDKLEEIVYTQMKTTDPISMSQSLVRAANWNLFAQLLGFMSEKRFLSVSDRFIADLEKVPVLIKIEEEPKLHLLISGMRYLKLTNYPLDVFEESAEFIQSLAKFFDKSQNETIIYAYCEVLSSLVLPLANILTAETNHPTWVEGIEKIFYKAYQIWRMATKNVGSSNGLSSTSAISNASTSTLNSNGQSLNPIAFANNGWAYSLHLMTSALSVSRKDLFAEVWFKVIEDNSFKLKSKVDVDDKMTFVVCMARLLWVYIYRLPDTLNNTIKKLDNLFQIVLFSSTNNKKNQWITSDTLLLSSLVELLRIVGFNHLNYVLDNVLIKILKLSFNGSSLENLSAEKLILTVRSYLAILEDYELGRKPAFPTDEVFNERIYNSDRNYTHPASNGTATSTPTTSGNARSANHSRTSNHNSEGTRNHIRLNEFMFIAKNSNNSQSHEEICKTFASLLKVLDNQYGSEAWSSESSASTTTSNGGSSKSQSSPFSFHFGIDFNYQMTKNLNIELFATLIDAIPWTMVPLPGEQISTSGISFKQVVEILTRNAIHTDSRVSVAAIKALKKLASRKNPSSLIAIFAKIAFQFTDKPGPSYNSTYLNSAEFNRLLKIYVDLLNCWLKQFQDIIANKANDSSLTHPLSQDDESMKRDVLNDLYQINHKNEDLSNSADANGVNGSSKLKPSDELEWKTIITVIEEVEGNGLFFLCSQDSKTRHYGITILKLVEHFDQAIYSITDVSEKDDEIITGGEQSKKHSRNSSKFAADVGTRLIHILEDIDFLELIKPYRKELSVPERSRLSKLKNRKHIIARLAESDYGIDSTIWFRLYPKLLDIFFEKCPMPVAMCRSIVCVNLVQMHELVLEYSDSYKSYTSSIFSRSSTNVPPEVLVNQWKLYLIFACCSLTTTNEQKISFPTQPTHGRKRSMQMFIQHQKITSAKSVFRMVLPLLKSQQQMVRDAVISGLSCININIFRTLLENVPSSVNDWEIDRRRDASEDRLRVEVVHILYNITLRFQNNEFIYKDEWMIANLVSIVKNAKSFLSLPATQTDIEFQRLRRFFCGLLENVFNSLNEVSDLNKWLPFEARIGCFNYLKEWCGYGDSSYIAEDRYNAMVKHVAHQKEVTSAAAILEVERKSLQFAALSCMAVLCSGHIKQQIQVPGKLAVMSFDIPSLMNWIHALFASENDRAHDTGKLALRNILTLNLDNPEIYEEVIKECYTSQESLKTTESYFTIFVDIFLKSEAESEHLSRTPYDLLCLANFLVGHDNYEVRFAAMKLVKFLEQKTLNSSTTADKFAKSVCSKTKVVYKKALYDISAHLATLQPDGAFIRISYMTKYFNLVGNSSRRDILSCLLPWVQTVVLTYEEQTEEATEKKETARGYSFGNEKQLDQPSLMVLTNLFEITVKFSSKISNEVEALWVALGSNSSNFDKTIDFIMSNCLERKNPMFVEYARQIIDYLAYSQPDPLNVIDKFIENLQPKLMVPPQPKSVSSNQSGAAETPTTLTPSPSGAGNISASPGTISPDFPYIADISQIISYNEKDAAFSVGQISMIFLVDLLNVSNDRMTEKLPLLLQVAFSLLDHYMFIVQEQAGALLIHLIHSLAPNEKKSAETIETLRQRDHFKYLWVYDDLNNDKKGARTPKNMDLLTRNILEIFSNVAPTLQDDWSRVSLNWATTCAVRHIACRSFQIFRSLLSFLDQSMLKDMLHRLSNTISDETLDIQGFAMQILMTLNAITAELDSEKLIDFPQLFWSSVACLSTIHEQEFIEVLSTMNKFVSKIDLDAPDTVSCLISTFPPKWEGKFEGLQQIVLVGLRSSTAWEPSIKFLDKLNTLKDSEIIGMGDSRLLSSILVNMPRFLHALDQKFISPEVESTATAISKLAENSGKISLSRILGSLAKNRFRSKKDFLVQTVSTIKDLFFPEFEAQSLVLLLGLLSNKISWVKLETMSMLKHIFPLVDLQRDEFVGVGADLISPLLRLLLTDYAEPALEVLDEAVIISGSQLDRDVLRMSLGNTSMKKEYEKTATLFGIPDENGWAIPMPAVTAASTRNNVHAVFSTCAVPALVDDESDVQMKDEEIQFHSEDYYAPPALDYGDSVSVTVEEPDGSLSNVWAALDDFDSFFTKDTETNGVVQVSGALLSGRREPGGHVHSASVDTKYSSISEISVPMDSAPNVYDKKVSVILNRSLARTQSNSSFKTSLADSIGASNYGNQATSIMAKRSYIPFRNSRITAKGKNETFSTPIIPSSPNFDPVITPTAFKTPNVSTPSTLTYTDTSSSPIGVGSSESLQGTIGYESSTRLEQLLGGSKKRGKKVTKLSPNASSASISPDLQQTRHNIWKPNSKGSLNAATTLSTPPATAQNPTATTPKAKDKKRNSQKFR